MSVGNNFTKNKPWAEALQRAMVRYGDGKENALNLIADQVVKSAINGDQWAITEIGNRTDGKPAQTTTLEGNPDAPIYGRVELVAVKPQG